MPRFFFLGGLAVGPPASAEVDRAFRLPRCGSLAPVRRGAVVLAAGGLKCGIAAVKDGRKAAAGSPVGVAARAGGA